MKSLQLLIKNRRKIVLLMREMLAMCPFLCDKQTHLQDENWVLRATIRNTVCWGINSQAPERSRGPRARCARSGINGESRVRSLREFDQSFWPKFPVKPPIFL